MKAEIKKEGKRAGNRISVCSNKRNRKCKHGRRNTISREVRMVQVKFPALLVR